MPGQQWKGLLKTLFKTMGLCIFKDIYICYIQVHICYVIYIHIAVHVEEIEKAGDRYPFRGFRYKGVQYVGVCFGALPCMEA